MHNVGGRPTRIEVVVSGWMMLCWAVAGCSVQPPPAPVALGVVPSSLSTNGGEVIIEGKGFVGSLEPSSNGSGSVLVTDFFVRLESENQSVQVKAERIDAQSLRVEVPAPLEPGAYSVTVVAPSGAESTIEDAITVTPPGFCYADRDGDGFGAGRGVPSLDGNCDGEQSNSNADCNDSDASRYPGAPETADDGIDQDCSGADSVTCFEDRDRDGFGTATTLVSEDGDCSDLGESKFDSDCDDEDASRYPGAEERVGDQVDQDCDGTDILKCYDDEDGDGFGSATSRTSETGSCPFGTSRLSMDCDDNNATVFPGQVDTPDNSIDEDCSGSDSTVCFEDLDGDGFGTFVTVDSADDDCTDLGESETDDDCNDGDPAIYPEAPDPFGDTIDQDCSGDDLFLSWSGLTDITIDGQILGLSGDVLDYPLAISFTMENFSDFASVAAGGDDLRFINAAGELLPYEVELWNANEGAVWVRIDRISSTVPTVIRMFYDNPSASPESSPKAVFEETFDSKNHLSADTPGVVGQGQSFNGIDDRVKIIGDDLQTTSLSAWVRLNRDLANTESGTVLGGSDKDGSPFKFAVVGKAIGQALRVTYTLEDKSKVEQNLDAGISIGEWVHLASTFDGFTLRLYVDGVLVAQEDAQYSGTLRPQTTKDRNRKRHIGDGLDATLDEVRVAKMALSDDWFALDYATQEPGQTVVTIDR